MTSRVGLYALALSADGRTAGHRRGRGNDQALGCAQARDEATLLGHEESVIGLAWSPDGKTLASTSLDGTVRLWDVATRQELGIIDEDAART